MGKTSKNEDLSGLRDDVGRTTEKIRTDYPFLDRFMDDPRTKTRVTVGEGPHYGEVYNMGTEDSSPYPDENVIEIRKRGNIPLDQSIRGELLHPIGGEDLQGNPSNEEYWGLKQEFMGNMTDKQLGMLGKSFEELKASGGTGTNAEDMGLYLKNSFIDGMIRNHMLPDTMTDPEEREIMRSGKLLSQRQREILEKMKLLLGY